MVGLDRANLVTIDAPLPPQARSMLPSDQSMSVKVRLSPESPIGFDPFDELEASRRLLMIRLARTQIAEHLDSIKAFLEDPDKLSLPKIYDDIKQGLSSEKCRTVLQEQIDHFNTMGSQSFLISGDLSQHHPLGALIALSIDILDKTSVYKAPILDQKLLKQFNEVIRLYNHKLEVLNDKYFYHETQFGLLDLPLLFNLNLVFFTVNQDEYVRLASAMLHMTTESVLDDIVALSLFQMGIHLANDVEDADELDFKLIPAELEYALRRIQSGENSSGIRNLKTGLVRFLLIGPTLEKYDPFLTESIQNVRKELMRYLKNSGKQEIILMLEGYKAIDLRLRYPMMAPFSMGRGTVNNWIFFLNHPQQTATEIFLHFGDENSQDYLLAVELFKAKFEKTGLLLPVDALAERKQARNDIINKHYQDTISSWKLDQAMEAENGLLREFDKDEAMQTKQDQSKIILDAYIRDLRALINAKTKKISKWNDLEEDIKSTMPKLLHLIDEQKFQLKSRGQLTGSKEINKNSHPIILLMMLAIYIWNQASQEDGMIIDDNMFEQLNEVIDDYNKHRGFYNSEFGYSFSRLDLPMLFHLSLAGHTVYTPEYLKLCQGFYRFPQGVLKDRMVALNLMLMGVHIEHNIIEDDGLDLDALLIDLVYAVDRLQSNPPSESLAWIELGLGKLLYALEHQNKNILKFHLDKWQKIVKLIAQLDPKRREGILRNIKDKDLQANVSLIRMNTNMNVSFSIVNFGESLPTDVLLDFYSSLSQSLLKEFKFGLNPDHNVINDRYEAVVKFWKDMAMQVAVSKERLGGIDMSSHNLDLDIKKDSSKIPLSVATQDLAQISIVGLKPEIIKIERVNLGELIGSN